MGHPSCGLPSRLGNGLDNLRPRKLVFSPYVRTYYESLRCLCYAEGAWRGRSILAFANVLQLLQPS